MKRILITLIVVTSIITACNQEKIMELDNLKKEVKMKNEIAERNKATTKAFFKALESENVHTIVDLFAEDAVH